LIRVFRATFPGNRSGCDESIELLDAQKAFILKQGNNGVLVAEICRKAGISRATYFKWHKDCAGLLPIRCGSDYDI
jgi:putative transposase